MKIKIKINELSNIISKLIEEEIERREVIEENELSPGREAFPKSYGATNWAKSSPKSYDIDSYDNNNKRIEPKQIKSNDIRNEVKKDKDFIGLNTIIHRLIDSKKKIGIPEIDNKIIELSNLLNK